MVMKRTWSEPAGAVNSRLCFGATMAPLSSTVFSLLPVTACTSASVTWKGLGFSTRRRSPVRVQRNAAGASLATPFRPCGR